MRILMDVSNCRDRDGNLSISVVRDRARTLFYGSLPGYVGIGPNTDVSVLYFGKDKPDRIVAEARCWNKKVADEFSDAVGCSRQGRTLPRSEEAYSIYRAAAAMNGIWLPDGSFGTAIRQCARLGTLVDEEDFTAIEARPQDYAVVTVTTERPIRKD